MTLSALSYYGGKSGGHGSSGRGRWIASLLPGDTRTLYAEPYAGMLGILLQRAPAKLEIVNDLNRRIVNWWRVVRDHPDELARMMRYLSGRRKWEAGMTHVGKPRTDEEIEHLARTTRDLSAVDCRQCFDFLGLKGIRV